MPKKKTVNQFERTMRAASLRWECIRRSKFYRADCDAFYSRFEDWFIKRGFDIRNVGNAERRIWAINFERELRAHPDDWNYYEQNVGPYPRQLHWAAFDRAMKTVLFSDRKRKNASPPKIRWDRLKQCLQVWDLKNATKPKPWTHERIAKKVFGDDYNPHTDPETPSRRVIRALNKAEHLIDGGGFRQIQ